MFIDAVLCRYQTGIPWRDLPARFGDFRVIHTRFSRWCKKGIWKRIFEILAADNEYAMLETTIVSAHQHSAGARKKSELDSAIGHSRGGLSTKIHAQALLADKAYDAYERVLQHRVNRLFHPNRIANSRVSMISGFIRRDI